MSARERILARLRAATQISRSTVKNPPDIAGWYARHSLPADADLAGRFRQGIELAHAEVHSVTREHWIDTLHQVLKAHGIDRLLVAEGTPHGDTALDELPPRGIDCRVYDMAIEAWKSELFHDTPASLTGAHAAIAETGTLILWPDEKEPRLMSLVPPVHIVLLDAARIYNTFFEAITAEGWATTDGRLPTNLLLISGPSKTADIQQTLAYGAHGPKALVVLMIEDGENAQ